MSLGKTIQDSRSEKEVRKQNRSAEAPIVAPQTTMNASRFTVEYWRAKLFRPSYRRGKKSNQVQEWYVQIQLGGRREKISLGSNNKEECARRAAQFYKRLLAKGWDAALTDLSPDRKVKPKNLLTLGHLIDALRPIAGVRPHTFGLYVIPEPRTLMRNGLFIAT
jgi:hypothetical protein